jgi:hypothetical protein
MGEDGGGNFADHLVAAVSSRHAQTDDDRPGLHAGRTRLAFGQCGARSHVPDPARRVPARRCVIPWPGPLQMSHPRPRRVGVRAGRGARDLWHILSSRAPPNRGTKVPWIRDPGFVASGNIALTDPANAGHERKATVR